jgi:hypothetical protein
MITSWLLPNFAMEVDLNQTFFQNVAHFGKYEPLRRPGLAIALTIGLR